MSAKAAEKLNESVRSVGFLKPSLKQDQTGLGFEPYFEIVGTSFWIKGTPFLVTCAHVVHGFINSFQELSGILMVQTKKNGYVPALIKAVDWEHDLALLRLSPEAEVSLGEQESKTGLLLEALDIKPGSKVGYSGYPLGLQLTDQQHNPTYDEGLVSKLHITPFRKSVQISGAVAPGYSGGPVVLIDRPEVLIGVISNSPSEEAGITGNYMAISVEHVRALIDLGNS